MALDGQGSQFRVEKDLLGELQITADAYYGVHTQRAVDNFPISGVPISAHPDLVNGLAAVKEAAAQANRDLKLIPDRVAQAIIWASQQVQQGKLHDQFPLDVIQGGAGTSSNMNANEVIANLALEHLGEAKGNYQVVHPLDHVNCSQSTNDAYPTAARLACHQAANELIDALTYLKDAFRAKSEELREVISVGRTQLQDAVPITLGQELGSHASTLEDSIDRVVQAQALLRRINLGGTAVGTGLNTPAAYAKKAAGYLSEITGIELQTADDLVAATWDTGDFVNLSGALRLAAVRLSKTSNDLRLLSSGPRSGFGDITLPPMQAGSSIMPGKVNPVIPEVVNQVAFKVVGNDAAISMAAEAGQLQLNAFEPVMVHLLLTSISELAAAARVLADRAVSGIEARPEALRQQVLHSIGLATALNPVLGYATTSELAKQALATGASIADLALEQGLLDAATLDRVLSLERLTGPDLD